MHKVIALIPARAGSKEVPNKNVRLLGGHSLLAWSIAACLKSSAIDRVIVSTDSAEHAWRR
jgi:CMP-N,N'-diacetyllegionaminic acid synthase